MILTSEVLCQLVQKYINDPRVTFFRIESVVSGPHRITTVEIGCPSEHHWQDDVKRAINDELVAMGIPEECDHTSVQFDRYYNERIVLGEPH